MEDKQQAAASRVLLSLPTLGRVSIDCNGRINQLTIPNPPNNLLNRRRAQNTERERWRTTTVMSSPAITYNVSSLTVEQYFGYTPSLALAWTAAGLFLAIAIGITLQVLFEAPAPPTDSHAPSLFSLVARTRFGQLLIQRNGNARYVWILVFSALAECGGYIALLWMIYATGTTSLYSAYVAMQALIVLTPNFVQAAVYRSVGQVSRVGNVSEKGGCLSAKFISLFFIAIDVACLIVQAIGIAIWATEKSSGEPDVDRVKLGSYITVVGLGLQLVSFGTFLVLARHIQCHKDNLFRRHREHTMLYAGVYLSILLVSIRNIFRFVEFLQGAIVYPSASSIADNQTLFYCLETLPVLLAFGALIVFSPTHLLPKAVPLESFLDSPFDAANPGTIDKEDVEGGMMEAPESSKGGMETVEL